MAEDPGSNAESQATGFRDICMLLVAAEAPMEDVTTGVTVRPVLLQVSWSHRCNVSSVLHGLGFRV